MSSKKLGRWKHGLRPNNSTIDIVFILKMILEKSREWDTDKYVASIDLGKGLYRINRGSLCRVLQHQDYDINLKRIRVIICMYENTESRVTNRAGK